MPTTEQQIAAIDWEVSRIKRQLIKLTEKNNVLENDLAPSLERLQIGREQEDKFRNMLIKLSNDKLKLGWKSHEANF